MFIITGFRRPIRTINRTPYRYLDLTKILPYDKNKSTYNDVIQEMPHQQLNSPIKTSKGKMWNPIKLIFLVNFTNKLLRNVCYYCPPSVYIILSFGIIGVGLSKFANRIINPR